jgi:hypothetical protein
MFFLFIAVTQSEFASFFSPFWTVHDHHYDDGTDWAGSFFHRMTLARNDLFLLSSFPLPRQSHMDFEERAHRLLVSNSPPRRRHYLSSPASSATVACSKFCLKRCVAKNVLRLRLFLSSYRLTFCLCGRHFYCFFALSIIIYLLKPKTNVLVNTSIFLFDDLFFHFISKYNFPNKLADFLIFLFCYC